METDGLSIYHLKVLLDMMWLNDLSSQNPDVHALALAAAHQNLYQPSLQDLDQGVARVRYAGHLPQPQEVVGRADGHVSPQEYLQGYVHFVRSDPLKNEAAANLLYQHLGLKLPFVMSDFNPGTSEDVVQKQRLCAAIDELKERIGYSGPHDDGKLQLELVQWLENNVVPSLKDKSSLKTVSGWEVFAGAGAACNGLENAYDSAFAYAFGNRVKFSHHELFYKEDPENDGSWLAHGFASIRVNDKLVYLDPARFVNGNNQISHNELPSSLQAMTLSDLENLAIDLVNHIREDRRLLEPQFSFEDRKKRVDLALLLAPDSIFVILEAIVVYSEILQEVNLKDAVRKGSEQKLKIKIDNFKLQAENLYPGSVQHYLTAFYVK